MTRGVRRRLTLDLDDPRNRAALLAEYRRRFATAAQVDGMTAVYRPADRAGYLPDGSPDPDHPVTARLDAGLAAVLELPAGRTRTRREADLFRDAVRAHHVDVAMRLLAPGLCAVPPSRAHRAIYSWYNRLDDTRPRPLVVCVNRGGGKSTSLELVTALVGIEGLRAYALYVHARQEKAADSVENIASYLTAPIVQLAFPDSAAQHETATGQKRDWRKYRIRTRSGFTLDALGMDQALRGAKVEEDRPGLLVLDDLEEEDDTDRMTAKKEENITKAIIPTLAANGAVVYCQNRIHDESMMAKVIDGRADYLATRELVGPIPQVEGLVWRERPPHERTEDDPRRFVITAGTPTWAGLDLATSERELNDMGPAAFATEKQHDTSAADGDKFPRDRWVHVQERDVPRLVLICRAWDLAASESEDADWTVGTLMGRCTQGFSWVLDVVRGQWSVSKVEDMVRDVAAQDAERFGRPVPIILEEQIGAAQKHYEVRWRKVLADRVFHYAKPLRDKPERADGWAACQQRGDARVVAGEWNGAFIREHGLFPDNCRNDDQVDSAAHAYNWLAARAARSKGRVATAAGRRA